MKMKILQAITVAALAAAQAAALAIGGQNIMVKKSSNGLQNVVTWDEHSLMVHGERIMIFGGEFHPYRLPVPGLWLDVFQKVKALGFNTVSFYTHWALLEGEPGVYNASGVFAFEPFFEAASKAGIYLIARPGPYINAESSGGGFPGWLQRVQGQLRTRAPDYLAATETYVAAIGAICAKYQITNGGPIILFQPENEYSGGVGAIPYFPDPTYYAYVEKQFRNAGIVVPYISNDAWTQGMFAPGSTWQGSQEANVDIYGHDSYPLGFDCANPNNWPAGSIPTYFHDSHVRQSPSSPYTIPEFQGGGFDAWGGNGFEKCAVLLNSEFERVFYKNNFASGVTIFSVYMIFGGTNWGNLGHAGGYTSYDYGASITENREIYREKYSELKLEGNFLKVTPAFLTASVGSLSNATYTNTPFIVTTPLFGNGSATNFYIVRHSDFQKLTPTSYTMTLKTTKGTFIVPQISGSLTLSGRDSKWAVTDYDLGGTNLLYSTAEIFTWKKVAGKTFLVVYGGPGELHELSVVTTSSAKTIEGGGVTTKSMNGTTVLNWETSSTRRVVQVDSLFIYLLDRNTAYNLWVPDFERSDKWGAYSTTVDKTDSVIVQAGYLVRKVYIKDVALHIEGDLNSTVPIKVIGAPATIRSLHFNSQKLTFNTDPITGELSSSLVYSLPDIKLPDLVALDWKYVDSLPELQSSYDDSAWKPANLPTKNSIAPLLTPTSLYGADYGYNPGTLVFRGHFIATGAESSLYIYTAGGTAFGSSVFLNDKYIGSWTGNDKTSTHNDTYALPNLVAGKSYVFTVLVSNNGFEGNWVVGVDAMKNPRGILNYALNGHPQSDITWKITGNLKGEQYIDKVRGPLNEGGLYVERQGFHQPYPPNHNWVSGSPLTGTENAGVAFYQASFKLGMPRNFDVPLSFSFGNTTIGGATANYEVQLYVNGWQFGKYINNIGPQSSFPVPQGILNYYGQNWLGLVVWARQADGAHLTDFKLEAGTPVMTGYDAPDMVETPDYRKRAGAY